MGNPTSPPAPAAPAAPPARPVRHRTDERDARIKRSGAGLFFAAVVAIIAANLFGPHLWESSAAAAPLFLAQAGIFLIGVAGAGMAARAHPLGVVIDKANRPSLSRLQMLLWTVVVFSALATIVSYRVMHGLSMRATDVNIPNELLAAMGIAATSLVAAPAILSLKPAGGEQQVASRSPDEPIELVDLIRGDEVGNQGTIDLSKLQQFAITVLLIGVYTSAIFDVIARDVGGLLTSAGAATLPALGRGFVELMAISHAGYLLYKAAPKPTTGSGDGG